jgi:multidrug efflux pump subunit AcrB
VDTLFYRNPRLTLLAIGLILVAGFSSFRTLPRQEDPTLSRRFGTVVTFYPGASALRVESLVTEKLEIELQELHEIETLESVSRTGVSTIQVELADRYSGSEVDEVWSKVRDRLAAAEATLPDGATVPDFEDRTSTATTLITALTWEQDDAPQVDILSRLGEELAIRLRNLPGTKEIKIYGEAEEEIRVTIDPAVLAGANLTAAEVSRAIAAADSKVPAGQLRNETADLLIEVSGELDSIERVRGIPLRQQTAGRFLRVGDIAKVSKTVREPPATVALIDGRVGVTVAATMEPNRRVDLWSERARAVVEQFRAELPRGIGFGPIFDQSSYASERLRSLVGNLMLGSVIVVAVLFVTMGARSALIVSSALPLTVAMVLAQLQLLGVPLHQTSVTGLIIALGLLIDNAIVVVDDFNGERQKGASPGKAVSRAVRHLFVPLLASTLTTVLAFLPIVLMPGGAGEFVGPISIGVGLSVTSSFLLSMTVVPALAGYFGAADPTPPGMHWWRQGFSHPRLLALYRRSLDAVLRRPSLGVAVSVVLPMLGFALATTLSEQFFPANDRDQFQLQLVLAPHASIEETRANVERARELMHAHEAVLESHWFLGESAPRVFYNMFNVEEGMANYAGGFATTHSAAVTKALLPGLQAELMAAFPNARVLAVPFEQGPPFEAPIEMRIVGPEIGELRRLGDEVRAILGESRGVTYTVAKLQGGEPKLMLRTDEEAARLAGLRLVDIADQLNASLEGAVGGSVVEANEEIPVRVRVGSEARSEVTDLVAAHVLPSLRRDDAADDEVPGIPLRALARVELVPEVAGITRRDGERSNTVQAFLVPYALIAESLDDFRERLDASGFELPQGYELQIGGESERRSEALGKLVAFALPLFVLMAGSIILSFNSFRMAGIIGTVGFLSIGLALFGVWLFGHSLGFLAIVGTMGLVGLAINGAIVVLSALRASYEAMRGDTAAIRDVVVAATRHILATTLTTIGGFLPLIVAGGSFWPPLATAIAGGVTGSAILVLYLVPSLFRWWVAAEAGRESPSLLVPRAPAARGDPQALPVSAAPRGAP